MDVQHRELVQLSSAARGFLQRTKRWVINTREPGKQNAEGLRHRKFGEEVGSERHMFTVSG